MQSSKSTDHHVDTLRTEDLLSNRTPVESPTRAQIILAKRDHISAENQSLREYLSGFQENHCLRSAAIVATILRWIDEDTQSPVESSRDFTGNRQWAPPGGHVRMTSTPKKESRGEEDSQNIPNISLITATPLEEGSTGTDQRVPEGKTYRTTDGKNGEPKAAFFASNYLRPSGGGKRATSPAGEAPSGSTAHYQSGQSADTRASSIEDPRGGTGRSQTYSNATTGQRLISQTIPADSHRSSMGSERPPVARIQNQPGTSSPGIFRQYQEDAQDATSGSVNSARLLRRGQVETPAAEPALTDDTLVSPAPNAPTRTRRLSISLPQEEHEIEVVGLGIEDKNSEEEFKQEAWLFEQDDPSEESVKPEKRSGYVWRRPTGTQMVKSPQQVYAAPPPNGPQQQSGRPSGSLRSSDPTPPPRPARSPHVPNSRPLRSDELSHSSQGQSGMTYEDTSRKSGASSWTGRSKIPVRSHASSQRREEKGDQSNDYSSQGPGLSPSHFDDDTLEISERREMSEGYGRHLHPRQEHQSNQQQQLNGEATRQEIEHAERDLEPPPTTPTRQAHEQFQRHQRQTWPQQGYSQWLSDQRDDGKNVTIAYYLDPEDGSISTVKDKDAGKGGVLETDGVQGKGSGIQLTSKVVYAQDTNGNWYPSTIEEARPEADKRRDYATQTQAASRRNQVADTSRDRADYSPRQDDPVQRPGPKRDGPRPGPGPTAEVVGSIGESRPDLERILAQMRPNRRLLGEIGFQLDRRILQFVFSTPGSENKDRRRFYGYTLLNIPHKIIRESTHRRTGEIDTRVQDSLEYRYGYILRSLQPFGYDIQRHAELSADLVNNYGLLPIPPDKGVAEYFGAENCDLLQDIVERIAPPEQKADLLILLKCLAFMASEDGKPMFTW